VREREERERDKDEREDREREKASEYIIPSVGAQKTRRGASVYNSKRPGGT